MTNHGVRRPHTELHATNDKRLMDLKSESRPKGFWPVFKGESFDLWQPDSGRYYAWAEPDAMLAHLQNKRRRGKTLSSSPFFEFQTEKPAGWWNSLKTLPCQHARIAFRDITNRTNQAHGRYGACASQGIPYEHRPVFHLAATATSTTWHIFSGVLPLCRSTGMRDDLLKLMNFFILNPFPIPRLNKTIARRQRKVELVRATGGCRQAIRDLGRSRGRGIRTA